MDNPTHDKTVLLFYQDYEADSFLKNDRYLKRIVRPLYRAVRRRPQVTGFLVWYRLLAKALRQAGYTVRENDYRFAKEHPNHPVGITGYPSILDNWRLPNPAVVGPGMFDHPGQRPELMNDPRFKQYVVTCDWMRAIFEPVYGRGCANWHAGMDVEQWPDTSTDEKTIDLLIYDKIRWNRDRLEPELLQPILQTLEKRGLRYTVIRYGRYDYPRYQSLLRSSRSMLFLCEHETQGMAYQECMASNVPVLAWDNGYWQDPMWRQFSEEPIQASSVPYFSPDCGERFASIEAFGDALDRFWPKLPEYRPRDYVRRELSFDRSASLYLEAYAAAGQADLNSPHR